MKYQIVEWDRKKEMYSIVLAENLTWDEATTRLREIRAEAKPADKHTPRTIIEQDAPVEVVSAPPPRKASKEK